MPREQPEAADRLARRYHRLLVACPAGYRATRADELVGTLLDLALPGQSRPGLADAADLLRAGVAERLRRPLPTGPRTGLRLAAPYAYGLAAAVALFALLV